MSANEDQRRFWSDKAGERWARRRGATDAVFAGVLSDLLDRAALRPGMQVLDIGCGAGTSTRAAAKHVMPGGNVTGLDISKPLLAAARAVPVDGARFMNADAQTHRFDHAAYDVILSRFGVMFFDDTAAALANMADALKPDGRMVFACWAEMAENPFFTMPAQIARQTLGPVPRSDPDGPGPFALRDATRTLSFFAQAGLMASVETKRFALPLGTDPVAIAEMLCEIGPAAGALSFHGSDSNGRARLIAALVDTLETYRAAGGITMAARIHFFTAVKAS